MSPDLDAPERAARAFEEAWRIGEPSIEDFWARFAPDRSVTVLASLVKVDIRRRYARGQEVAIADYLIRFPDLGRATDRMVSLIYEEYCLREERGERPDPSRFCDRYEPWRDSLESQLHYHHLLSQVAGKSHTPTRFPEPGDRFQWFQLRSMLGQGGVARVYLANDEELGGRAVALKVSPDRGKEPSIMGRLDHPHIVPVLSVAHEPATGLRGLCMPYRPGLPLDEVLRRIGPGSNPRHARGLWEVVAPARASVAPGDGASADGSVEGPAVLPPGWEGFPIRGSYAEGVSWIILTLARALEHAHSRDILHLDVKPANVLLTRRDGPQLLDFNLAHEPHSADQAEVAFRGGTLPYMAPEQLEAFLDSARWQSVAKTADLYSLGLLLRELLTGRLPEVPDPNLPVHRAVREMLDLRARTSPSLRTLNPKVPHALDAIAGRCLAHSTTLRYQDARELAEDLELFLEHRPLRHAPNTSTTEATRNWLRRNALWGGGAITTLLLAFTLLLTLIPSWLIRAEDHYLHHRIVREYQAKDYGAAAKDATRLASLFPRSALPHILLALIRSRQLRVKESLEEFQLVDDSSDTQVVVEAYQVAASALPDSYQIQLGLARAQAKRENWEPAKRAYQKALDLNPEAFSAYHGLAQIADAQGDIDQFRAHMDEAIKLAQSLATPPPDLELARLFSDRGLAWLRRWERATGAEAVRCLARAGANYEEAEKTSDAIRTERSYLYWISAINRPKGAPLTLTVPATRPRIKPGSGMVVKATFP